MNAEATQKHKAKEKLDLSLAWDAFQQWVNKGRMVMVDGDPYIKTKCIALHCIASGYAD